MFKRSDFLIIGSTGQNTGKTTFAEKIIKRLKEKHFIIGLKITVINKDIVKCPKGSVDCNVCGSFSGDYEILEEKNAKLKKDTSIMLKAGAKQVFWLKVDKNHLKKGVRQILKIIPKNAKVICESNSVRKVITPSLFLIIKNEDNKLVKQSCSEVINYADKLISFKDNAWDFNPDRIFIKDEKWVYREKATAIILAGGNSIRMKGKDKSLLDINGIPLIQHIINQLEDYFDEIIIGSNKSKEYDFLNHKIIADLDSNKGPLMGILSCLKSSSNNVNFITACDMPVMDIKFIMRMIKASADADIIMPVWKENKYEPLFAVYKKSIIKHAETILKTNKRRVIELNKYSKTIFIDFPKSVNYFNINEQKDYEEYLSHVIVTHKDKLNI